MSESAQDICRIAQDMESKKFNFLDYAQMTSKYCMPSKAQFTFKKSEGERVETDLYDSTGIDSSVILAAGLQTYLTSPYSQWFTLGFKKKVHRENKELQEWAVGAGETLYEKLNSANFNRNMAEFYQDLVVLPGSTLYKEQDPTDLFRFYTIPFDEVLIMKNARGIIDTVYRKFKYTVYEAYGRWGEACGSEITELYNKKKFGDTFGFIHATAPRYERNVSKKDNKNMPFYSCFVLEEKKKKVEEGGYKRNPYYVGRWAKVSGNTWGYSPAMVALPDIMMLNRMSEDMMYAVQQALSPAWMFPDEDFLMPLNMNPRGINFRTGEPLDKNNMPYPMTSGAQIPVSLEYENQRRISIQKKFFVDLFTVNYQQTDKTAYEIAQQAQRNMLILGSVIGDLIKEVLEPMLNDCLQDMYEAEELPEIPMDGIMFEDLSFSYISPLAIAQKAAKNQNLNAFLGEIMQMGTVIPNVMHKVNWDKAVDEKAKINDINPNIMQDEDVVLEIRTQQAQQQQQANEMLMAEQSGKALDAIGKGVKSVTPEKPKK